MPQSETSSWALPKVLRTSMDSSPQKRWRQPATATALLGAESVDRGGKHPLPLPVLISLNIKTGNLQIHQGLITLGTQMNRIYIPSTGGFCLEPQSFQHEFCQREGFHSLPPSKHTVQGNTAASASSLPHIRLPTSSRGAPCRGHWLEEEHENMGCVQI